MLLCLDLVPALSSEHFRSVQIVTINPTFLLCFCSTAENTPSVGTKRSLSEEKEENDKQIKTERDGKRARLDGDELEAQLELKITANGSSRHKLEKVRYLIDFSAVNSIFESCRLPQNACFFFVYT